MRPTRVLFLLLLALTLPATAGAQGLPDGMNPILGGKHRPVLQFTAPAAGDYASLPISTGQTATITRASAKTVQASATALTSVASGHFAVDYRGLSIEESRTNKVLQSGDLSNAAWNSSSTTVLGSQGVFVDGTTTEAKVTSSATTGIRYQQITVTSSTGPFSSSCWFQSPSGSLTPSMAMQAGTATTVASNACSTLPSQSCTTANDGSKNGWSWTNVSTSNQWLSDTLSFAAAQTTVFEFVSPGQYGTAGNNGASVFSGGCQFEQAAFATSYIPTTTTAVTRSADQIDLGAVTLSATPSLSATVNLEGFGAAVNSWVMEGYNSSTDWCALIATNSGGAEFECDNGGTIRSVSTAGGLLTAGTSARISGSYDGTNLRACVGSTCATSPASFSPSVSYSHLYLGSHAGGSAFLNGFLSYGCADKRPGGCS